MPVVRFVQFSDVHLDARLEESKLALPEEKRQRRQREVRQVVAEACSLAKEKNCDVVLIPGDLFDDETAEWDTVRFLMDRFGSIAPVPVFITPGNHDPYLPQSPYNADFLAEKEKGKWTENVHIFSSNSFQTVCLEARDDVTVTGIANVGREFEQRRILGERISLPEAAVNILMVHGSREPFPPGKEATMPFSDAELLSRGFDYAAIGHYHTYAEVKDGQGRIRGAYSGTPASQRLSEVGEKFVLLGEIAEDKTVRLEKVRLDRRALHSIEVNCCGLTHSEAVIRKVEEEAGKTSNNRDDILFIRLAGRFPCGESLKLPADLLADKYFHVATDTSGLQPDYDLDKYLQEPELIRGVDGDYVKALLNQEAQAPGERERRVIRAALYYGLDALEEGKLCGRYED
jgi:DNA repair exonuclease SbcCD nuclease subunit